MTKLPFSVATFTSSISGHGNGSLFVDCLMEGDREMGYAWNGF